MRLALYQPDIAPNVGTLLRLAACMDVPIDIIEPCGFPFDERAVRRSALDYFDHVALTRHAAWGAFTEMRAASDDAGRLILLTTTGDHRYDRFRFQPDDTLMAGRESAGVPEAVRQFADVRLRIPMKAGLRSLNVAIACAMALGEALRQTNQFPGETA